MDNITHTLIGVLVGEAAARGAAAVSRPAVTPSAALPATLRRSLIVTALAVGSNLPDADLLYTSFASGRLQYVLQHRGYTHTLPGALACALLLWLACEVWLRWRRLRPSAADRRWIVGSALAGVLLHLAMDYTNSYGVHPLWPLYDGWIYGDSVFIVEPLIWVAAAPLLFLLRTRLARLLVAGALVIGTVLVVGSGFVPRLPAAAFVALLVMAAAAGRLLAPRAALATGLLVWLGVTGLFVTAGHAAGQRVDALARERFPDAVTLDHVLTPMPADPACWDVLLVQSEAGSYVVRAAHLSLAPAWIAADACRGLGTLMRRSGAVVPGQGDSRLQWLAEYRMPADRIAMLAAQYCEARAFMQFARVPWAFGDGASWRMGDLRFGDGAGLAQLRLAQPPAPCAFVPVPWLPPRPELLRPD